MTQLGTKKSRKGCANCKRRRVKVPCANCTRRGEDCSLLGPPSSRSDTTNGHPNDAALPNSTQEWLLDLELMHHFDRSTSLLTLGIRDNVQQAWREHIPREGLKHAFLMHGLLALSALHLAYEKPAEADKYTALCDKHQMVAMEMFRSVLSSEITREVSTALFALASTLSMSSMARSCAMASSMTGPQHITMEQVAELFFLTRGVHDVISTCQAWVNAGPLGPLLHGHDVPNGTVRQWPPEAQAQFEALHAMLEASCSEDQLADCKTALDHLQDVFQGLVYYAGQNDLETGQVWRWTVMVPSDFVRLIRVSFPPALLILAHFAAASTVIRNAWYTDYWGNFALAGIRLALAGSDLLPHLDWPARQVETGMTILTKRDPIDPKLIDQ